MALEVTVSDTLDASIDVVGVPFFKGPRAAAEGPGADVSWLSAQGFEGKPGQTQVQNVNGRTVIAVGIGEEGDLELDSFRRLAAAFVKASSKSSKAALLIGDAVPSSLDASKVSQALAEGALLGAYRFTEYKSEPSEWALSEVVLVGADSESVDRGVTVAGAVSLARDLVNHPPGNMTPRRLAEVATEVAQRTGMELTILDENAIEAERLGGLRGVSMGSDEPPRLIEMTYEPSDGFDRTIALVGKGITFDSGGLSLKTGEGMMTMKTDMSGAAAVIAAMSAIGTLAPRAKVVGIVCATENLPGPKATKPGDVLRARNGKTMEVLNTDAEGRLVLADGLSLAAETDVDAIIDVATLTGACIVALGTEIAGMMGNNEELKNQVAAAAEDAGEPVWHLPLPKRYRKHIDSEIADIKNIGAGKGAAGSLSAGLFLQEFVDGKPWVHLDIAGPARAESDDGYIVKGGTGFAVRTLVNLVTNFESPRSANA